MLLGIKFALSRARITNINEQGWPGRKRTGLAWACSSWSCETTSVGSCACDQCMMCCPWVSWLVFMRGPKPGEEAGVTELGMSGLHCKWLKPNGPQVA